MRNADQGTLRLEVEADPTGLVNGIKNPSGDLGAWGWLTPVTATAMRGGVGSLDPCLTFASTATSVSAMWFASEETPVAPGEFLAAFWHGLGQPDGGSADIFYQARIEYLDTALAVVSTSAPYPAAGSYLGTTGEDEDRVFGPLTIPAGAAFARLRFDFSDSTGSVPAAAFSYAFRKATLVTASTSGALGPSRTNALANHDFSAATKIWVPASGSAAGRGAGVLQVQLQHAPSPTYFLGCMFPGTNAAGVPVTPGETWTFTLKPAAITSSGQTLPTSDGQIYISWFDASGNVLAQTVAVLDKDTGSPGMEHASITAVAPAGAARAIPGFRFQSGISWSGVAHSAFWLSAVQFERGDTFTGFIEGTVTDEIGYVTPDLFVNILGDVRSIGISGRGELQVGTLTATVINAALDPAVAAFIKPDKRVRVMARTGDTGAEVSDWQPIFTGRLIQAQVAYNLLNAKEARRATITLTAVDNVSNAAQVARSEGVATIAQLPALLEGAGVPWNVNGSGDEILTVPAAVSYNDQASLVDQIALTRDSVLGYAWADRFNVIQVWDRDRLSSTVKAVLDESAYNQNPSIDYDSDRVVDSVTVTLLTYDAGHGVADQQTFGPYVLPGTKGTHSTTFTVAGLTAAEVAAYAQQVLDLNGTASRRVNSVVIPIQVDEATGLVNELALLDVYDLVTVINERAAINEGHRIIGVSHDITAQDRGTGGPGAKWLMTLSFAGDESVAMPQLLPSAQVGPVGPSAGLQKGSITASGSHAEWTGAVTFPEEYATTPNVQLTGVYSTSGGGVGILWHVVTKSTTGFTWRCTWLDGGTHSTGGSADWVAQ
ncbi:hypothetical protein P5P86_11745 [Nocardioides sp. BP30]|uniref:hypothetical protein n=1 Tax=Nocardioides sp. BP30 TaxID=3036374 RepID=UPI002468281C|nr:hypothetical protein [Nocardioides sp. BP30]WGL50637.1 hypothetical protein P5P86_11745 [Nocardioides sp. BP30]